MEISIGESRQVKWQNIRRAKGLCVNCGKRKLHTKFKCRVCAKKANARANVEYHKRNKKEKRAK